MAQSLTETINPHGLGFDPTSLALKYQEEKDKRVRKDAVSQYREPSGVLAGFEDDTFKDSIPSRPSIDADVAVLIVGAGLGGIITAVHLAQKGVTDVRIVDKAGSYGGTWYWNQYPGVRCDVESYIYMPLLEETGYIPKEKYATGDEILEHMGRVVAQWDLASKTLFNTEAKTMEWDESKACWNVTTARNDCFRAQFVVTAPGLLHTPKLPGVPGIENFQGHSFHTSRWDYAYTGALSDGLPKLADKRIALIGTGASAVQIVPFLQQACKHLYVFQRTPSSIAERNNHSTNPSFAKSLTQGWQQARMSNFNAIVIGQPVSEDLINDGWTSTPTTRLMGTQGTQLSPADLAIADFSHMENLRNRISSTVHNPQTAEALKPWYGSICKRPCFHDEYLPTFNATNLTLIHTDGRGVSAITPSGVVAKPAGSDTDTAYDVDCIIYSTGFATVVGETYSYAHRTGISVTGTDGCSLEEAWKFGPQTLFGLQSHGFPNWFDLKTAQSGVSPNVTWTLEHGARHVAYVVEELRRRGKKVVEPREERQREWVEEVREGSKGLRGWLMQCTPGYWNNEGVGGRAVENMAPFGQGANAWAEVLRGWREEGGLVGMEVR
ncbi:MAG: hypothetical protein M1820_004966 [Bogoriella megaspora]|nr:MAG: hypothetical protein M1820_004966 [Bogoriella megaspora]